MDVRLRLTRNRADEAIRKAIQKAGFEIPIIKVDTGNFTRTCTKTRCQKCGIERIVSIGDFNLGKGKYCSHKCSIEANMVYSKGSDHHNWRGGKPESSRRYSKYNPHKQHCRLITRGAIGLGWIVPKPCEVCGDPKSQIHHPDYTNPFLVYFLCRNHHLEVHGGSFHKPHNDRKLKALLRATNKWMEE